MNKKLLLTLVAVGAAFANNAIFAANNSFQPNIYGGLQAGIGFPGTHMDNNRFASRLFAGYNALPCLGIEAGYTYFAKDSASSRNFSASDKIWVLDLVAKGIYQFDDNWSAYGKAGLAYVDVSEEIHVTGMGDDSHSHSLLRPTYGLGVAYNFNQKMAADLSWTGIYNTNSSTTNTINTLMLGFSYKFANI